MRSISGCVAAPSYQRPGTAPGSTRLPDRLRPAAGIRLDRLAQVLGEAGPHGVVERLELRIGDVHLSEAPVELVVAVVVPGIDLEPVLLREVGGTLAVG